MGERMRVLIASPLLPHGAERHARFTKYSAIAASTPGIVDFERMYHES